MYSIIKTLKYKVICCVTAVTVNNKQPLFPFLLRHCLRNKDRLEPSKSNFIVSPFLCG